MTTETIDGQMSEAVENGDFEAFREASTRRDADIQAAIEEGLRKAGVVPTGIDRWVVGGEANRIAELLGEAGVPHDDVCQRVTAEVTALLREPLRIKVLSGYYAEHFVADVPPSNGIVGAAIDSAIETFRPYAKYTQIPE